MTDVVGEKYVLGDLIGVGGMGCVYAAEDPSRSRVAVKLLHRSLIENPSIVARFVEEGLAAQRVSHRNVVRVLDHGTTTDGVPYLVMNHVPGTPLGKMVQHEGPLALSRIRSIGSQILAGLAAIHHAGLVHGDLKSDNILVDTTPGADRVTIIDFGLARPPGTDPLSGDDQLLSGTPEYMAPELIRGEPISTAADLYAVGITIYEMLTGTTPFGGGTTTMVFERQLADDVVPPSLRCEDRACPVAFEHVILRALDKHADKRHLDAELFAAALECALRDSHEDRSSTPARSVAFSTVAPTRDWVRPRTPEPRPRRRRHAEGTVAHDSAPVSLRRDELRSAVATNDPDPVVVAYLALAEALIEDHRLPEAGRELEAGIAWFARTPPTDAPMWRLVLTLAAVYDGLDDPAGARRAAHDAYAAADRVDSELGRVRSKMLLRRLDAAGGRADRRLVIAQR